MRTRWAALAVLVASALAASCGGGGGDPLTKEEYIAEADAICKDANEQIDALGEPQSAEDIAEFAEQAVAIGEEQLAKLRALRPPEADEATLNGAYELIEQQLDLARQLGPAAEEGDLARIQELVAEGQRINDEADQIAADYGLEECGSD
jgi:hypothetical protein